MHTKKLTADEAMQELQSTKHEISTELASAMVKRFGRFKTTLNKAKKNKAPLPDSTPVFPNSLTFNRAAIYRLMKMPGCAGIRCYLAINAKQELRLVIVGVDEKGENMLASTQSGSGNKVAKAAGDDVVVLDEGQASPPYPPKGGEL